LSKDIVRKLSSSDCAYCGSPPSQVYCSKGGYNGDYIYNGIDRVNNSIGYEENNVVACCKICNTMKSTLSQEKFFRHIKRIVERW
jgi:hypothetical protein